MRRLKRSSTEISDLPEEDRELLAKFVERLRPIPGVEAIVLFGSFARKDIDRRSDIDLLIVVDMEDPGSLRPRMAKLISELKPHREINPTLTNLRDMDSSFLRTVFQEGVVLHGKMLLTPDHLALEPRVLLAYDLSGISPSHKVHFSRMVHGFQSHKIVRGRRRTYRYAGLGERHGATFVSRSVLFLKPGDAKAFIRELEAKRVPFTRWDVYL